MKHFTLFFMKLEFLFCCYFDNFNIHSCVLCMFILLFVFLTYCRILSVFAFIFCIPYYSKVSKDIFNIYRLIFVVYILLICLLWCFLNFFSKSILSFFYIYDIKLLVLSFFSFYFLFSCVFLFS